MEKQETANDKRVHRIRIFENKRDRKPGLYRLSEYSQISAREKKISYQEFTSVTDCNS